jgi:L-lysine exporter family protein LysE/ArgO
MNLCLSPFLQGCGTGAALIIAIGAQNVFALKQGILKNHIFTTALIFSLTDALLIGLGV